MCVSHEADTTRTRITHLLPSVYDVPVAHQPLPRQGSHLVAHAGQRVILEQLAAPVGQSLALGDQVVVYQAELAVGQDAGADIRVASVASAEANSAQREAVLRDVLVGGGQDFPVDGPERRRGRVVVRVVVLPPAEGRSRRRGWRSRSLASDWAAGGRGQASCGARDARGGHFGEFEEE